MVTLLSLCLLSSFADSLYTGGDYGRAVVEYKRLLFAQAIDTPYGFYRIAMSYKLSRKYEESIEYLKDAFENPLPDSLADELSLELADTYLRSLEYPRARLELEEVETPRAKRLYAVSYLLEGNFQEAGKALDERADPDGELRALAREGGNLRLLDPNRMAICSAILPGSGQVLSGHLKYGFLSFLLSTSSGFLIYDALRDRRLLDASLIFAQLFSRFYIGNIRNAYRLSEEENLRRRRALLKRSLSVGEYLE